MTGRRNVVEDISDYISISYRRGAEAFAILSAHSLDMGGQVKIPKHIKVIEGLQQGGGGVQI